MKTLLTDDSRILDLLQTARGRNKREGYVFRPTIEQILR